MRTLLGLLLATVWSSAPGQSCTPAEPRSDPGTSFSAFASLERLEVRGGRPGNQDWEWGLGTNTQQTGSFVKSYLDWVSGRVLTYTLTYNGAGAGTFTVYDGATQLTTQSWNDPAQPLRAGNALKFYVKSSADSGTATVQATVATINGLPASGSIQTAGNSQFSEAAMYWYFPGMQTGFTVTGTVTLTYPGTNPPQGSRLNFIVTAGTITCQQASTPPGMYFIHVDHLNTPRLVANAQGQTVWRWDQQEPFGVNVPDENPSGLGTFDFALRFPGQYFDKETSLHYNYFRDYDSAIGRYTQSDPIGLIGGLNTYAYVNGNPLSLADLTGEFAVGGAAAAAAVITVGAFLILNQAAQNAAQVAIPGTTPNNALTRGRGKWKVLTRCEVRRINDCCDWPKDKPWVYGVGRASDYWDAEEEAARAANDALRGHKDCFKGHCHPIRCWYNERPARCVRWN